MPVLLRFIVGVFAALCVFAPGGALAQDRTDRPAAIPTPIRDRELPQHTQYFLPRPYGAHPGNVPEGFFAIPGTDAFVKLGLAANLAFMASDRLLAPTWFATSTIPVERQAHARRREQFAGTANQSEVSLEVRKQSPLGSLRLLFNTSFAQAEPALGFHPNFAYAQAGPALVGFTTSTFTDPDAYPRTLDFAGPNAIAFSRHGVLRYSFSKGRADRAQYHLHLALEQPSTQVPSSAGKPREVAPDGVVALRAEGKSAHVQLAGIVRGLAVQGTNDVKPGYGGNLTGNAHLGDDAVQGGITAGRGIGAYLNDLGGGQYDAAVSRGGDLEPLTVLAAYLGLTHHWLRSLSSTATYGYLVVDDLDFRESLGSKGFRHSQYGALNLIHQPFAGALVGIEGLWGQLRVIDGARAEAFRMQTTFQYRH